MRSVLTLIALMAIAVPVFGANPTLESFSNPDFVVDTNSPPLNGPSNVIHTALSVRSGNSPGDQFFLTVNGTNIALLQSASFNPTVGTLPVRGTTNWLDSRILQPSANVVNIGTNATFDLSNGRLTVTKRTGGSFLPIAALDDTSYPDIALAEIGGASMILTPKTNNFYDFTVTGTTAGRGMEFRFANSQPVITLSSNQNVIIGNNTSSANRATNYLYIPFGTGTPVGTPLTEGSHPAMYWDSTGDLLYVWSPATGWHIVGTNIFYGTNNFTINPTDWKVPYRVNATTLGDTGMHPTNVNDMVFDGSIDATTITSHDTLNAAGAFVLSRSGAFPITTTNPNQIDVVNLGFAMMTSDVDATDPTLRTITLNTGHVGQIIEIENTTNFFVGVTQSAFSLTNGTPLFDDASKYVFLSGGDWNTTNSGEGIWLQYNGLYWHEIDRVAGPGGGSGNVSGAGTANYLPIWTSATGLGVSPIYTNANDTIMTYDAAGVGGGLIVSNKNNGRTATFGLKGDGTAVVDSSAGVVSLYKPTVVYGNIQPDVDDTRTNGLSAYRWADGNFASLTLGGVNRTTWPSGGGGGNLTVSGAGGADQLLTWDTDTTGHWTDHLTNFEITNLTVTGTMTVPITNQVLETDGSGTVVGGGAPSWTNSGGYLWPAGTLTQSTAGITIRADGSTWIGTNSWQDEALDSIRAVPIKAVSMVSSNDPKYMTFGFTVIDDENYNYESSIVGSLTGDPTTPNTTLTLTSYGSNHDNSREVSFNLWPEDPIDNPIQYKRGGTNQFVVAYDGSVTAAGNIVSTNGQFVPASFSVSGLPSGVAIGSQVYCSDCLTPWGSGDRVEWDGANWKTLRARVPATTDLKTYACNAISSGWQGSTVLSYAIQADTYKLGAPSLGLFNASSGGFESYTVNSWGSLGYTSIPTTSPGGSFGDSLILPFPNGVNGFVSASSALALVSIPDGTDTWMALFGCANSGSLTNLPTIGCFVIADPWKIMPNNTTTGSPTNHWILVVTNAASGSFTDTGLTIGTTLTAPDRIAIISTSTTAYCYTNGVLACSSSTGIPAANAILHGGLKTYRTAGSTAKTIYYGNTRFERRYNAPQTFF